MRRKPKLNKAARGNCYQAAYALMFDAVMYESPKTALCHGVATQTRPPHNRMGHAWVEFESEGITWVRDGLMPDDPLPAVVYYAVGRIGHVVRYTRLEAAKLALATENYGPWDEAVAAAAHA